MDGLKAARASTDPQFTPVLAFKGLTRQDLMVTTLAFAFFASLIPGVNGEEETKDRQWSKETFLGLAFTTFAAFVAGVLFKRVWKVETRVERLEARADGTDAQIREMRAQLEALGGPRAAATRAFLDSATPSTRQLFDLFREYLICLFKASCAIHSKKISPAPEQILTWIQSLAHIVNIPGPKIALAATSVAMAYDQWQKQGKAERAVRWFLHEDLYSENTINWIACKATQEVMQRIDVEKILRQEGGKEFLVDIVGKVVDAMIEDGSRFTSVLTRQTEGFSWTITNIQVRGPLQVSMTVCTPLPTGAFGKQMWAAYFGKIGEEPPIPDSIYAKLPLRCPFSSPRYNCRIKDTHALVLVPKSVNLPNDRFFPGNRTVSVDNLPIIAKNALRSPIPDWNVRGWVGGVDSFFSDGETVEKVKDFAVQKSHWVLVYTGFPGEPKLARQAYKKYADDDLPLCRLDTGIPYKIPNLIDGLVCTMAIRFKNGYWIDETWCQDTQNNRRLVIKTSKGLPLAGEGTDYKGYPCVPIWDLRDPPTEARDWS